MPSVWKFCSVCVCVFVCVRAYVRAYVRACVRPCVRASVRACVRVCVAHIHCYDALLCNVDMDNYFSANRLIYLSSATFYLYYRNCNRHQQIVDLSHNGRLIRIVSQPNPS